MRFHVDMTLWQVLSLTSPILSRAGESRVRYLQGSQRQLDFFMVQLQSDVHLESWIRKCSKVESWELEQILLNWLHSSDDSRDWPEYSCWKCLDSFFELLRKFFNSMKNLGVEAIAHEQATHEWVWTSWFSDWGSVCTCSSCLICLGTILWRVGLTLQRWDSTGKAPVRVGNGSNFHMRK